VTGKVWLVGAGPGDPGLMTVRAVEVLSGADVVVYDYLVEPALLDLAPAAALRIYMGKSGAHTGAAQRQAAIEAALIEHAQAGLRVVRLKGGDPFVFGRGGEEAQALRAAGLAFEVVPGVSSAIAVPAYAGIPVTHRDHNTALAVVTGHEDPNQPGGRTNWPALASFAAAGGTLVILMGVKNLARNMNYLVAAGVRDGMPVALVQRGTRPDQLVVTGSLGDIVQRAAQADLGPPAVCIVGPVAALADTLSWFAPGALAGARVWVPRPRHRARELCGALRHAGGRPLSLPLIGTSPFKPETVAARVASLSAAPGAFLAFTSAHGVRAFAKALWAAGDARRLAGFGLAAVGQATAAALLAVGLKADVSVNKGGGAALGHRLLAAGATSVLGFLARKHRPELGDVLGGGGVPFDVVPCYVTRRTPLRPDQRETLARVGVDVVVLTSPSIAEAYLAEVAIEPRLVGEVVAIGATTAATVRAHGTTVAATAATPAVQHLVQAVHVALGVS
jgi:uroporphyrinogen III methyltransferase / synthase